MITQKINEIESKLSGVQLDPETKQQILALVQDTKTEAERLLIDHKRTTDQSVMRKGKLGQLSNTILDLQSSMKQMDVLKMQNQKLSKYRQHAVKQKLDQVNNIKQLFDMKLTNTTAKDYNKYLTISSQFNFQDTSQQSIQKNLQVYNILKIAGTFDGDKSMMYNVLPKARTDSNITKNKDKKKLL